MSATTNTAGNGRTGSGNVTHDYDGPGPRAVYTAWLTLNERKIAVSWDVELDLLRDGDDPDEHVRRSLLRQGADLRLGRLAGLWATLEMDDGETAEDWMRF